MAGWKRRAGCVSSSVLVLACGGFAGGAEMPTVAYFLERPAFESIASGAVRADFPVGWDPFAPEKQPDRKPVAPKRLTEKPAGTRFLREEDRMWLLTGALREVDALRDKGSWAVWNEDTSRLVVSGTVQDHGRVTMMWDRLNQPWRVLTEVALHRVPCRELGSAQWSAEEIGKRGGEVLAAVTTSSRSGQKAAANSQLPDGAARLETEVFAGPAEADMNVCLAFTVPVVHADGIRTMEWATEVVVNAGEEACFEVGGADEEDQSYVVSVKALPEFMDGTPTAKWREFEDEGAEEHVREIRRGAHLRVVWEDGFLFGCFPVPPPFDVDAESDPTSPFAFGGAARRVKPPEDLPGARALEWVLDVQVLVGKSGVKVPEGGWVCYAAGPSMIMAKLDAENMERLETLVEGAQTRVIRMVQGTASLIEWRGELEPGSIPDGARRLARVGAVGRPGQKVEARHSWPADRLERGVSLAFEPQLGGASSVADMRVIGLRMSLEAGGERPVKLTTGLTTMDGQPVVLPVGAEGDLKFGVVFTSRVIDGGGRAVHGGD